MDSWMICCFTCSSDLVAFAASSLALAEKQALSRTTNIKRFNSLSPRLSIEGRTFYHISN
jgi:hypothetical protein